MYVCLCICMNLYVYENFLLKYFAFWHKSSTVRIFCSNTQLYSNTIYIVQVSHTCTRVYANVPIFSLIYVHVCAHVCMHPEVPEKKSCYCYKQIVKHVHAATSLFGY